MMIVLKLMKKINLEFLLILKNKDQTSKFDKSIFTVCDYRENDKCPSLVTSSKSNDT